MHGHRGLQLATHSTAEVIRRANRRLLHSLRREVPGAVCMTRSVVFKVVTTCSKLGYEQYGKRMLESLHQHWPEEGDVALYSEDVLPPKPLPKWLHEFKARHAGNKAANGKGTH